jgi:hypothetical protein
MVGTIIGVIILVSLIYWIVPKGNSTAHLRESGNKTIIVIVVIFALGTIAVIFH